MLTRSPEASRPDRNARIDWECVASRSMAFFACTSIHPTAPMNGVSVEFVVRSPLIRLRSYRPARPGPSAYPANQGIGKNEGPDDAAPIGGYAAPNRRETMVELRTLAYFITACRSASLAQAAGDLDIAISTLSTTIKTLDEDLCLTLYRRINN